MVAGRGSRGGKKLWRCEVRPHLNPLPGGEEVASLCNPYTSPGFPPRIGVRGMLSSVFHKLG